MYNYDLTTPICLTTQTVLYTKYVKFNTVSVNVTVTVVIVSRKRFYFLYFVLPLWRADYAKVFFFTKDTQYGTIIYKAKSGFALGKKLDPDPQKLNGDPQL